MTDIKRKRTWKGFAVFDEAGSYWHSTTSHKESYSKQLAESNMGESWEELSKRGYTCRRVTIREGK